MSRTRVVTEPYYYYGWAFFRTQFKDDTDFLAMAVAFVDLSDDVTMNFNTARVDQDLALQTPINNLNSFFRLREGIERFFITDINNPAASAQAASDLVLMHDAISLDVEHYNHLPGGSNVLYGDGHVEFVKYPGFVDNGQFPVNEAGIILHEIGEGAGAVLLHP